MGDSSTVNSTLLLDQFKEEKGTIDLVTFDDPDPASTAVPKKKRKERSIKPRNKNFIRALEAVRFEGMGFCKAARMHGVNNRTLWLEYQKLGYPSTKLRKSANRKEAAAAATT